MLMGLSEAKRLIQSGKVLHVAGVEKLLAQLPSGNWIGGTTPYFMSERGGIVSDQDLYVNAFDSPEGFSISLYDEETIKNIGVDAFKNGFTLVIFPFGSRVLEAFAKYAPEIDQIFIKNIAGWVSGFDLSDGQGRAKVFNGRELSAYEDRALALHIGLPGEKIASIDIINIFEPDENSPFIEFPSSSFEAASCLVDGKETNFAGYIAANGIDTRLPLVADYSGANINISIKEIAGDTVKFYAPVFKDMKYRFAKKIGDYVSEFERQVRRDVNADTVFSCNCILNYLYGKLEGRSTEPFFGPVTFGEVAYQLVNQTLVYVTLS